MDPYIFMVGVYSVSPSFYESLTSLTTSNFDRKYAWHMLLPNFEGKYSPRRLSVHSRHTYYSGVHIPRGHHRHSRKHDVFRNLSAVPTTE